MLTVAIPTYHRGAVLCDTIEMLLRLETRAGEILVIDQTAEHSAEIEARLQAWHSAGVIRHIRLPEPSITHAMNTALLEARHTHVLFLDDDVIPSDHLLSAHSAALAEEGVWASVGQVLQPGEVSQHFAQEDLRRGPIRDLEFRFNSDTPCDVHNVMAGNLAVERRQALRVGGFDENFVAVAYRFETDFALRLVAAGGRIRFVPSASIHHLKAPGGGVRAWGDHRTSPSPMHSVGDYYFARHHIRSFWKYVAIRLGKNVATGFHARHPWTIPLKIIGELRGLRLALLLSRQKRRIVE